MTNPAAYPVNKPVRMILILAWIACTAPSLIQNLTTQRRANAVAEVAASSQLSSLIAYASVGALILYCVARILTVRAKPNPRGLVAVFLLLTPWTLAIVSSLAGYSAIPVNAAALPIVVFALWILNAKIADLRTVAWLTGATAVIALAMGALAPAQGLLHGQSGLVSTADKAIIGETLLAGPFNHSNQLGVVLALGLPAIFLLGKTRHKVLIFLLTSLALAWSSSRGSLLAVAAFMFCVWWVSRFKSNPTTRRVWSVLLALPAIAMVAYLPLTTDTYAAYSERGQIWLGSLAAWNESPMFGYGYAWYSEIAKYVNDLIAVAFNGHNLFVHAMVTGGLVLVAVLAVIVIRLMRVASAESGSKNYFALAYTISFFMISILEVPTRWRDIDPQFWVAVIPVAVLVMHLRDAPPPEPKLALPAAYKGLEAKLRSPAKRTQLQAARPDKNLERR